MPLRIEGEVIGMPHLLSFQRFNNLNIVTISNDRISLLVNLKLLYHAYVSVS
jgi:hypothetical protein